MSRLASSIAKLEQRVADAKQATASRTSDASLDMSALTALQVCVPPKRRMVRPACCRLLCININMTLSAFRC